MSMPPPPLPALLPPPPLLSLTGISRRTRRGCGHEAATCCGDPTACGALWLRSRCCWCRCPGSWPEEDVPSRLSLSQSPRWPYEAGWRKTSEKGIKHLVTHVRNTSMKLCRICILNKWPGLSCDLWPLPVPVASKLLWYCIHTCRCVHMLVIEFSPGV